MIGRLVQWWRRRRAGAEVVKQLLERAEDLAVADGIDRPGAEHLLLAACDVDDGTAGAALAAVGSDRAAVVAAIDRAHRDALESVGISVEAEPAAVPDAPASRGVFRSDPSLQQLLRATYDLVEDAGVQLVGAWVVVAAVDVRHGTVARAVDRFGVDRTELREAARRIAVAHGSDA